MTQPVILVIDDDTAIQSFVSMSLANEGYAVEVASDGLSALEIMERQKPSVILLDMRMPKMDGRAFIKAYHNTLGPHVPIIMMTAGRSSTESASVLGVSDFLPKPFDLNELLTLIGHHLQ